MTTNLIDFQNVPQQSPNDFAGLRAILSQLIGELYQFARISYGDELTLHFGDLKPARSPKLRKQLYGTYILGLRGSPWILKAGSEPLAITAGLFVDAIPGTLGKLLSNAAVESQRIVEPKSRVLLAVPFVVKPVNGIALQLRFSDGSSLLVIPAVPELDAPEDESLPELADWELQTPRGLLSAGPGLKWTFAPAKESSTCPTP